MNPVWQVSKPKCQVCKSLTWLQSSHFVTEMERSVVFSPPLQALKTVESEALSAHSDNIQQLTFI